MPASPIFLTLNRAAEPRYDFAPDTSVPTGWKTASTESSPKHDSLLPREFETARKKFRRVLCASFPDSDESVGVERFLESQQYTITWERVSCVTNSLDSLEKPPPKARHDRGDNEALGPSASLWKVVSF